MSKLIVEVCKVDEVLPHPNGDFLDIARIKGWKTAIKKGDFQVGDKCVFFPPDSVLPNPLADKLGVRKYLHELPKDVNGNRPNAARVVAAVVRGVPSYGLVIKPEKNWEIGTDVAAHFGVSKYEPSEETGYFADKLNSTFFKYTDIQSFANYNEAIPNNTDVVITEKIHGINCRFGLVRDNESFIYMVGSHDIRRKEFYCIENTYNLKDLFNTCPPIGKVFTHRNKHWKVESIITSKNKYWRIRDIVKNPLTLISLFKSDKSTDKIVASEVRYSEENQDWEPALNYSIYWKCFNANTKHLLMSVLNGFPWPEEKYSIIVYGEIYGPGTEQDMQYGLNTCNFRAFDISINGSYLDFDAKANLFNDFYVSVVPVLYRGPFKSNLIEQYTSGPTTLCDPKLAGNFKGREGIVITPTKEVNYCPIINGRRILKSVSADYLARKNGKELH